MSDSDRFSDLIERKARLEDEMSDWLDSIDPDGLLRGFHAAVEKFWEIYAMAMRIERELGAELVEASGGHEIPRDRKLVLT